MENGIFTHTLQQESVLQNHSVLHIVFSRLQFSGNCVVPFGGGENWVWTRASFVPPLKQHHLNQTVTGSIQKGLYLNCSWCGQRTSQHYAVLNTSWLWSRMTLGIGTPEQLHEEAARCRCSPLGPRSSWGSDRCPLSLPSDLTVKIPSFASAASSLRGTLCLGPYLWQGRAACYNACIALPVEGHGPSGGCAICEQAAFGNRAASTAQMWRWGEMSLTATWS